MGGPGSGVRGPNYQLSDVQADAIVLSISRFRRIWRLGRRDRATIRLRDDFLVWCVVDLRDRSRMFLDLRHQRRDTARQTAYRIKLMLVRAGSHGQLNFKCPLSGRIVRKLFLPEGASKFGSRPAHKLAFPVWRESPINRAIRRANKVRAKISNDDGPFYIEPTKRPWLYRRTYQHELPSWRALAEKAYAMRTANPSIR